MEILGPFFSTLNIAPHVPYCTTFRDISCHNTHLFDWLLFWSAIFKQTVLSPSTLSFYFLITSKTLHSYQMTSSGCQMKGKNQGGWGGGRKLPFGPFSNFLLKRRRGERRNLLFFPYLITFHPPLPCRLTCQMLFPGILIPGVRVCVGREHKGMFSVTVRSPLNNKHINLMGMCSRT